MKIDSTELTDASNEEETMSPVTRSGPVRYARAARFAPPEPTDPRAPERTDGQICPQRPSSLEPVMGPVPDAHPQGEDCLALSVVAPTTPGPHPVLVFLHGGAFVSGSGLMSWYDGAALAAEHDVVVVSVSYRLGPFGWLRLDGVAPGNLGLLDQAAALRWVHEGIERWGGDPERITLAGQSAGSVSTALLLEDPAVRALVRRGIAQSGPPYGGSPDEAGREGRRFAELLGDGPRTAPPGSLLDAAVELEVELRAREPERFLPPWGPVRGVDPLPAAPVLPSVPGALDLLVGWNHDEVTAFGADLADALAPSERVFAQPWLISAQGLRDAGVSLTGYRLDWRPPGSPYGAVHCLELPLLLGDRSAWRDCPMLGDEPADVVDTFGRQLRAAWAGFARAGRVNPSLTPDVPLSWAPDGDLAALTEHA